jgi:hypothetical protein
LKKYCRKKPYKNHLRSNNYEVCTAVARCFPNIVDVMVLENINLSSDEIGRPPLWSNEADLDFCHQSPTYAVSSVYFNLGFQPNVNIIPGFNQTLIAIGLIEVFNFSEKIT